LCRLLGMTSNFDTYLNFTFEILSNILKKLCNEKGICHRHGCGIAWVQTGRWEFKRDENPLWESAELKKLINWTRTKAMIIHARMSTYPEYSLQGPKLDNAHPFVDEIIGFRWVFIQNGYVKFDRTRVRVRPQDKILEYRGRVFALSSYGVDSEVFFKIFMHELREYGGEEPRNVINTLEHLLSSGTITDYHSLNFIMGSHRYLYAFRYYNEEREEYEQKYTLYYMKRTGLSPAGKILKKRSNEIMTFISSEPITGPEWIDVVRTIRKDFPVEGWIPIKNRQMITVPIGKPDQIHIEQIG